MCAVCRDQLRADYSEIRRIVDVYLRVEEVGMVEEVEEVGGDFNLEALVERSRLAEARVEIPETQSAERMTGAIAAVAAEERIAEISGSGSWIREYIDTARSAKAL